VSQAIETIAWSYDLLTQQEQRLFRLLSAFVGGCTLQAASAVASLGGNADSQQAMEVLDWVTSLVDKSLLQQTKQEGEEPRLLMLETVREYGWECLIANSEALLASSLGEASVATSRLAGDNWTVGEALGITALALFTQGHLEPAQHLLEECLTICRETGNKRSVAYALSLLGLIAYFQRMGTRGHLLCEVEVVLPRGAQSVRGIDRRRR
jgi:hypothetical protein